MFGMSWKSALKVDRLNAEIQDSKSVAWFLSVKFSKLPAVFNRVIRDWP